MREVKPNQWFVLAASSLALLAVFFSIGGLADVWWAGANEIQMGRQSVKVAYTLTLWENTVDSGSTVITAKIDDHCGESELPEDDKANCGKIRGVRAIMFLKLFAVLPALACPVARLVLQCLHGDDASSLLQKRLLTAAIACKAFASFCAFVATCIAPSLDFEGIGGEVGAAGAGYVLTILSMIFCLWPAIVLECIIWRRTYWLTSETRVETPGTKAVSVGKASSPKDGILPTLVGSTPAFKGDASKSQNAADLEAGAATQKRDTE